MDLKYVKDLIALLEKSNLQRLVIKEKNGIEISLDKGDALHEMSPPLPARTAQHQTIPAAPSSHPSHAAQASHPHHAVPSYSAQGAQVEAGEEIDPKKCVTSPMVGTFYAAESPDSPAYVREGATVKQGDILCIIEAMKVMNEVKSDRSGKIAKILIEDGAPVEYGQPLFMIES